MFAGEGWQGLGQMAYRTNMKSIKHIPEANCPWRDATNRWASSKALYSCQAVMILWRIFCGPILWKTTWKMKGLNIWLDIIQHSIPKRLTIFWLCRRDCKHNTVHPRQELRRRAWNRRKGAGHKLWRMTAQRDTSTLDAKSNVSKVICTVKLNKPWSQSGKLNDMKVPR